jgi:DNA polymerase-3 subunit gamma/tau
LKGHGEVVHAALPIETAEMALLRIVHAASLPDPGDLARRLASGEATVASAPATAPFTPVEPKLPATVAEIVELFEANNRHMLAASVRNRLRPVRLDPPELVVSAATPLPTEFVRDLSNELKAVTGRAWKVTTDTAPGAPTLAETSVATKEAERADVLASPLVAAAFEAFPDAELIGWTNQRSA